MNLLMFIIDKFSHISLNGIVTGKRTLWGDAHPFSTGATQGHPHPSPPDLHPDPDPHLDPNHHTDPQPDPDSLF